MHSPYNYIVNCHLSIGKLQIKCAAHLPAWKIENFVFQLRFEFFCCSLFVVPLVFSALFAAAATDAQRRAQIVYSMVYVSNIAEHKLHPNWLIFNFIIYFHVPTMWTGEQRNTSAHCTPEHIGHVMFVIRVPTLWRLTRSCFVHRHRHTHTQIYAVRFHLI